MAAVRARGLRRTYGDTIALDGVDISVETGSIVTLIGPNGAGKTTLVRCLTGTTEPDAGEVSLLGSTPNRVDPNRIGLLPQAFSPPARLTARELVRYYAGLYEQARSPVAVLDDVGIDASRDTWYRSLSGGQRRRVCVATSIVHEPDVLFLDEPTTGIDPAGRRAVWRLIESLRDSGTTIILTTHNMVEASRLADRVLLLHNGTVIAEGAPETLIEEHGGPARLTVTTDADPSTVSVPTGTVRSGEDGLLIEGVSPADIGDVVSALETADVAFEALSWREPTLEDVYLAIADDVENELEMTQ